MPRPSFNTVPTELVEHAEIAYSHFRGLGYQARIEPLENYFPSRPTFLFTRGPTRMAVLVCGRIDVAHLEDWVSLAKSMTRDFRVAICVSVDSSTKHLPQHHLRLQQLGVGVFVSSGGHLSTRANAVDQSINVTLPNLARQPSAVRTVLGPAYEHFDGGRWRECFAAACTAFEQEVRPYLKRAIKTGRLTIYDTKGRPKNPTLQRIDSMTLGQLKESIGNARPLNGVDTQIQKALAQINPDRVGTIHKNKKPSTETRLRKNVGLHMHAILQAVRQLKQ